MRSMLALAALAAILAGPTIARAAGPNGGAVTLADGHPVEFVATDSAVSFFLTDEDGKPMDTSGIGAKAYVQAGGRTTTVALKGAPPNRLVGALDAPLPTGAKVVLSAKAHGHNLQARFEK